MKILLSALIAVIAAGSAFAQNWTQTSAPIMNWNSVASSSDGNKLVAVVNGGGIWASANSGTNWAQTSAPSTNWTTIAASADGSKLVAAASVGGIWVSTDSGTNWTQTSAPNTTWFVVTSSADGNKLVAAVGGQSPGNEFSGLIYTSTNSGVTWKASDAPYASWDSIASSADGTTLMASAYGWSAGEMIYTSTNSGATWHSTSAQTMNWISLASSDDEKTIVGTTCCYGQIYVSTNSGISWTMTAAPTELWGAVASSADGTKMIALAGYSPPVSSTYLIFISADSGSTWTTIDSPNQPWGRVALTADGLKLITVVGGGGIYIWQPITPVIGTQLLNQTVPAGTNVTFSIGVLGTTPPAYQWQFNTTNLIGATNAIYTLTNVALSASGSYAVLVTNSFGKSLSTSALLTVLPAIITSQPQPTSQTVASGIDITYSVSALTTVPLSYQWQINGTNLLNATNATLTLTNVTLTDSGIYTVLLTNVFGGVLSSNAQLTVLPALVTTQPENVAISYAVLNGSVTPGLNDTVIWFEWGTDTNYGYTTPPMDMGEGQNQLNFSNLITDLTPYTVYHYQAIASNVLGIVFGGDVSFTTVPLFVHTSATNLNWSSIACSADGTKIVAESSGGGIWISTNSGDTWMQTSAPNTNWVCVVSSADGTKLAAPAGSTIYTSTNSGITWTPNDTPTSFSFVASSADGDKLVGLGGGHVFISTNSGATWTQTSAPSSLLGYPVNWTSAASSADGTQLMASGYYIYWNSGWPVIYVSTNSGSSWNSVFFTGQANYSPYITASADGNKIVATGWWGTIYSSTNSGATWAMSVAPVWKLAPIVSSADGAQLIVISSIYEAIYVSMDSGATWVQASAPPYVNWNCIASSADGNELIAGCNGGIYISKFTAPPALNIAASNKLTLSWLMPSANFVLQQNSDLITANWTDVTNTLILNLTNLQNQVFLPMSGSNSFYRLATP